jgi:hypothetical protein
MTFCRDKLLNINHNLNYTGNKEIHIYNLLHKNLYFCFANTLITIG